MFEHLSDPDPPRPGAEERALVRARATRLQRRARVVQSALALSAVVVVLVGALAFTRRGTTTPVDVVNAPGACCGSIAGTVRGDQGGLKLVVVQLLYADTGASSTTRVAGRDASNPWRVKAQIRTDQTGHYSFDDLEPGRYVLRFVDHVDESGSYAYEPAFYDGAAVFSKATPVTVVTKQTTPVDVTMHRSANWGISGRVQLAGAPTPFPIKNITVRLFVDGELTREATTDQNGDYRFGGVDPGTYTIAFVDVKNGTGDYATSWYDDGRPLVVGSADVVADGSMVRCPGPDARAPLEGCA